MNKFPIAAGIRADCEEIAKTFQATDSVRFEEFVKIWNDLNFGDLLTAFDNEKDMLQFTEECFLIALSFCHPIHQFQYRTVGLYLLYGFYFKQTTKFKLKIRITSQQWEEFLSFIELAKEQCHHDIHYIFQKLKLSHAFHFVAHPRELAPFSKDFGTTEVENSYALHSSFRDIIDDGYVDQIESLHQHYVNMKKEVVRNETVHNIKEDFVSTVKGLIKNFETKRDAKLESLKKGKAALSNEDEIGKRRMAIKSGLYRNVAKTEKSRRHRAVELDESLGDSPKKKKKYNLESDEQPSDDSGDELSESSEEDDSPKRNQNKKDNKGFVKKSMKKREINDSIEKGINPNELSPIEEMETNELRIADDEDLSMPMLTVDENI